MGILNSDADRIRHYSSDIPGADSEDPVGWIINSHRALLARSTCPECGSPDPEELHLSTCSIGASV